MIFMAFILSYLESEFYMQNNATDKLSPLKKLTTEQQDLVNQIINFTNQHLQNNYPAIFTIYGDAGTGKSVVLSALLIKCKNYVTIRIAIFIKLIIIF